MAQLSLENENLSRRITNLGKELEKEKSSCKIEAKKLAATQKNYEKYKLAYEDKQKQFELVRDQLEKDQDKLEKLKGSVPEKIYKDLEQRFIKMNT